MRAALAALLAAFVAGCGFHLAGSLPLPRVLQRIYIELEQPYKVSEAPLERTLRERLVQRGAKVVSKSEKAETRLRMWNLSERREALSIGPDGKALEYRLLISVDYEVRRGAELLLPPNTLTASRDYSFEPGSILAKESEESDLREFIQGELAELLLLRMEIGLRDMPAESVDPAQVVPPLSAPEPAPAPAG